jgi:hypothetical protein
MPARCRSMRHVNCMIDRNRVHHLVVRIQRIYDGG